MKKKLIFLSAISLSLIAIPTSIVASISASEIQDGWTDISILPTYDFNSTFTVPGASYYLGGVEYKGTATVRLPNGKVVSDSKIVLNVPGEYRVIYTAVANDEVFSKDATFFVPYGILSYNQIDKTRFKYQNVTETSVGIDPECFIEHPNGLFVALAAGDTITFNEYIDITNLKNTDELVKMFVLPETYKFSNMDKIQFTFTDSADESNKITVLQQRYSEFGSSYTSAAGTGQTLTGWERTASRTVKHVANEYGTPTQLSFNGANYNFNTKEYVKAIIDNRCLNLTYDKQENSLYSLTNKVYSNLTSADITSFTQVCDFDSDDFAETWSGFKSNKIKLSITCLGNNANYSYLFFTKVYGLDLTQTTFAKSELPTINIQKEFDETPLGEVNKPFKIPSATASDIYFGNLKVNQKVYYRYDVEGEKRQVPIIDGEFTPTQAGLYAVVYSAKDWMGVEASTLLSVIVVNELPQLDFDVQENVNCYLGEKVALSNPTNITGGSGCYSTRIVASLDGETLEVKDNEFVPTKAGSWTISFIVRDYIGNEFSKNITASVMVKDGYIAGDLPVLPNGYVSDLNYTLPKLNLYKYSDDGSYDVVPSKVRVLGQEYTSGSIFVPSIDTDSEIITLTYELDGETFATYEVPCFKNKGQMELVPGLLVETFKADNYFITNGNKSWESNGIKIVSDDENTVTTFANELVGLTFNVTLSDLTYFENGNVISVVLTNAYDLKDLAILNIKKSSSGWMVYTSPKQIYNIENYSSLIIAFNGKDFIVNDSLTVSTGLEESLNIVRLDILSEANESYTITSLCSNVLASTLATTLDRTAPELVISEAYGGSYNIGDIYQICPVYSRDVFSPNVITYLTVKDPDGEVVTDLEGNLLQNVSIDETREIRLTKYGDYSFSYYTSETPDYSKKPNYFTKDYIVTSVDDVAPTITFNGAFKTEAKVNDLIVLPNYTLSDNYSRSENIKVTIGITNPHGFTSYLPENSNSFYVSYTGTYEIRYMVFDETGNITLVKKYLEVK